MRRFFSWFLVGWLGVATAWGQHSFAGKLAATARPRGNTYYALTPGSGYALRVHLEAGQSCLRELQAWLHPLQRCDTVKVPVRVRLASMKPTGQPADDDLLPAPMILTPAVLRQSSFQPLVFTWPPGQVVIPQQGAFIIFEGIGNTPDEYVSGLIHSRELGGDAYQVTRRLQPEVAPYLLRHQHIALLLNGKPTNSADTFWLRGDLQPDWRLGDPGMYVPLLKVGLE